MKFGSLKENIGTNALLKLNLKQKKLLKKKII